MWVAWQNILQSVIRWCGEWLHGMVQHVWPWYRHSLAIMNRSISESKPSQFALMYLWLKKTLLVLGIKYALQNSNEQCLVDAPDLKFWMPLKIQKLYLVQTSNISTLHLFFRTKRDGDSLQVYNKQPDRSSKASKLPQTAAAPANTS